MYSYGKKTKYWELENKKGEIIKVACNYSFFAFIFIIPAAWNLVWYASEPNSKELEKIDYNDLYHKYGAKTPKLGLWTRAGLWLLFLSPIIISTVLTPIILIVKLIIGAF